MSDTYAKPQTFSKKASGRPERARFTYHDENGREIVQKIRFDDTDEAGKKCMFSKKLNGAKLPLYRLPDVLAALRDGRPVYVAEGEKDADTLAALGLAGTSAPYGAVTGEKHEKKWPDSYTMLFTAAAAREARADLVLVQDADPAGVEHLRNVARLLAARAPKSLRVVPPFPGPKGTDVTDYLAAHGREKTLAHIEKAEEWKDEAEEEKPEPLYNLARRVLENVKAAAPKKKAGPPEDAAVLLRDVRAFVRRYVVLTPEQEVAVTLWTLHTWAIEAADLSPYLSVSSAVMRTGKTRLLETVERLVRSPWRVVQPSEAVLFRKLGQGDSTLLFDEIDTIFGRNVSDAQEGIRAVLNCGFQRGATIPRCIDRGQKIEEFSVFGAKLLAGIGLPPPTVRDRSFVIEMKRKKKTENVSRFRRRDAEALAAPLRERLERWAASAVDGLKDARPALPEKLGDRAQDAAEPLLSIADAAGAEWPALARKALVHLAGEDDGDEDELGVLLLADVRAVFDLLHRTDGEIPTATLLSELYAREESPWKKLDKKGEPLDARGLARLLRPFGVKSKKLRVGDETPWGYVVSAFTDPFERYLSPDTPSGTAGTAEQSNAGAGESVPDHPEQHPEHDDAEDGSGLCSGSCSGSSGTVSINEDGPCAGVPDVPDKVPNEDGEEAPIRRVVVGL